MLTRKLAQTFEAAQATQAQKTPSQFSSRQQQYLNQLLKHPHPFSRNACLSVIDVVAARLQDAQPPSPVTLVRWLKRHQCAGTPATQHQRKRTLMTPSSRSSAYLRAARSSAHD